MSATAPRSLPVPGATLPFDPAEYARRLERRSAALLDLPVSPAPVVRVCESRSRSVSNLHRFEVRSGEESCRIIVKEILGVRGRGPEPERSGRPRRAAPLEPVEKLELESASLRAVHAHFERLRDPRFGAVRLLETLPASCCLVMEEVPHPTLRHLFLGRAPAKRASPPLLDAVENAGACLRAYHACPPHDRAQRLEASWEEELEMIGRFCEFLRCRVGKEAYFRRLRQGAAALLHRGQPGPTPLAFAHGDYAMRNILVAPDASVTVLDVGGRWLAPAYEDVAYFLVAARLTAARMTRSAFGFRLGWLERYERALLRGYFGSDPVPIEALRLFEVRAILDKWCAVVASEEASDSRAPLALGRVRSRFAGRLFRSWLRPLEAAARGGP